MPVGSIETEPTDVRSDVTTIPSNPREVTIEQPDSGNTESTLAAAIKAISIEELQTARQILGRYLNRIDATEKEQARDLIAQLDLNLQSKNQLTQFLADLPADKFADIKSNPYVLYYPGEIKNWNKLLQARYLVKQRGQVKAARQMRGENVESPDDTSEEVANASGGADPPSDTSKEEAPRQAL